MDVLEIDNENVSERVAVMLGVGGGVRVSDNVRDSDMEGRLSVVESLWLFEPGVVVIDTLDDSDGDEVRL